MIRCLDRCISRDFVCDGLPDCDDGSDEADCNECSPRAVRCKGDGKKCVNFDYYCEGFQVCEGGSDEQGCQPKQAKPYDCTKQAGDLSDKRTCNGFRDCPNGEDEFCHEYCGQYQCADGKCVTPGRVCDGYPDLKDGKDEWNCLWPDGRLSHKEMALRMTVGSRVVRGRDWIWGDMDGDRPGKGTVIGFSGSIERRVVVRWDSGHVGNFRMGHACDSFYDLRLLTDEFPPRRPQTNASCAAGSHLCGNRCIARDFVRDGVADCEDRTDEFMSHVQSWAARDCSRRSFYCSNSVNGFPQSFCIPLYGVCDGRESCVGGSDETECSDVPSGGRYRCKNNAMLDVSQVCNGVPDCGKAAEEDESGCTSCQGGAFFCNGTCVSPGRICDGYHDCPGGEDEQGCAPDEPEELSGRQMAARLVVGSRVVRGKDWKWGDVDGGPQGQGIVTEPISYGGWVGVRWDSGRRGTYRMGNADSFDLRLLPAERALQERVSSFTCPAGSHKCSSVNRCLAPEFVCDGRNDCTHGSVSDENFIDCKTCNRGAVPCKVGSYTPDYQNITLWQRKCPVGIHKVCLITECDKDSGGVCVRSPFRPCDGYTDCHGGSDDDVCPGSPNRTMELNCRSINNTRKKTCSNAFIGVPGTVAAKSDSKMPQFCLYYGDEEDCTACQDGAILCDGRCVSGAHICDGFRDCSNGLDEQGCYPEGPSSLSGRQTAARLAKGSRVVRGRDWIWGEEMGRGTVTGAITFNGWVEVTWDNGKIGDYRMGYKGKFDLQLLTEELYNGDACGKSSGSWSPFVVNGREASLGAVPWHAGVYRMVKDSIKYQCGASLVSATYVVSAAHCVVEHGRAVPTQQMHITLGQVFSSWDDDNSTESRSHKYGVNRIIVADKYEGIDLFYFSDIALLRLDKVVQFGKFIAPICLHKKIRVEENDVIQVLGWGNGTDPLKSLASVGLQYKPQEACIHHLKEKVRSTSLRYVAHDKFCAASREQGALSVAGLAPGDSGGGAVVKRGDGWFLVGIVSVGLEDSKVFGFTNVTVYYDWLLQTINT